MWECLLGIRHEGCPISDTSASVPGISVQNVSRVDVSGNHGRRLLHIQGESKEIEEFERVCLKHELVLSFERVTDGDSSDAYFVADIEFGGENPSVLSILNAKGMFHHGSIVVQDGIEHWLVYSEEKSLIRTVEREIESHGNSVYLYRMVDLSELGHINDIQFGNLLAPLTDQQRRTFRTALELGYYDGGSSTTVSDIADELGVHETTAWEHLDKAENAILTDVGRSLFATIRRKEV